MRFLRGLAKNNDRNWFEERRSIYERALKAPLLELVHEINAGMDEFAPEFIRPPHKIAMRIFRDTRFSPDKRPYKHNVSAWWAQRGLEKSSGAGFYLQVGPSGSFLAAVCMRLSARLCSRCVRGWRSTTTGIVRYYIRCLTFLEAFPL